ncbi:MAG: hypothetical protein ACE5FQ_10915 [Thiogranum sp.]
MQSTPEGKGRNAQVYVGDNQVRLEYTKDDLHMVEIYDMKNHRLLLMVPQMESYMLRRMPEGKTVNPMLPPLQASPCTWMPAARCRSLASESLYGRKVTKWEMTRERKEQNLRSLHWMDDERHMPLREEWPDGSVSELRPAGLETLNGRSAERWEMKITQPGGEELTSTQWYDPELQITVREEKPGGKYRELRDIRVGAQPAQLFRIPAGYTRLDSDGVDSAPAAVTPGPEPQSEQRGPQRQGGNGL